jgi:hypothetical protein
MIKKFGRLTTLFVILITLVMSLFPAPALAIADPLSAPQVSRVDVYSLADGGIGVLVDYYLDYIPPYPAETATESYLAIFIAADGTTQLKSVAPYTFQASGYKRGMIWIPFTAAEVATYGITSASIALYRIWLMGNPSLTWTPGPLPPKTVATIDEWHTTGTVLLLATKVLFYADQLELAWGLDMIQITSLGPKLTTTGESYFENVVSNLRTLAPSAFSSSVASPLYSPLNYSTDFGATATNGTAIIVGSPVTLLPNIVIANPSFEIDDPPVGWTLFGTGATFTRSDVQAYTADTFSGLLTRVGVDTYVYQDTDPELYVGQNVTMGGWVYATVANRARLALDDDVGAPSYSNYHTAAPGWEWLTVHYTVNAAATSLQLYCQVNNGNTLAYFDDIVLVRGINTIQTGLTTGNVTIDLAGWTYGAIYNDGVGTLALSPSTLKPGVNTINITGAGNFTVSVATIDTVSKANESVIGTGLDLTVIAKTFGMSRWMFSGLLWMMITIMICAAAYKTASGDGYGDASSSGGIKVVLLLFTVCVIGGTLLGLLAPAVSALLFIMCGAFIGYILFFRSETLHKGFMFMMWMFIITSLAGNIMANSQSGYVATRLTADLAAGTVNSISVSSTTGFPESGKIVIGDETISYPNKTTTTFERNSVLGITTNPIIRGSDDTSDVAHTYGSVVRTVEAGILNSSVDYKIANLVDTAGIIGYLTLPAKLLDLIITFFVLPLSFLGTDLAILTYIWLVVAIGMIVGFVTQLIGGRRV